MSAFPPFYVALLHHPIVNKQGEIITTSVTNMDIHDISRSARTYGAEGYEVITPIDQQHQVVKRILDHWNSPSVLKKHPDRVEAVSRVRLSRSFEETKERIYAEHGQMPEVVMPDARPIPNSVSYSEYRSELQNPRLRGHDKPVVIVFGTGWGISETFFPRGGSDSSSGLRAKRSRRV